MCNIRPGPTTGSRALMTGWKCSKHVRPMPMVILFYSLHNPLKKLFRPDAGQRPMLPR